MNRLFKNVGKSWKTRSQELEHGSKMRLLKTHSQTSGRRDYEADKERQEKKGKERRPIRKGQGKRQRSRRQIT